MDLTKKKVFLTGADGFIGSHLTEALVKTARAVTAFLHYNSHGYRGMLEHVPEEVMQNVNIVWGDLKDGDSVRRAMKSHDAVFHLGAIVSIPYSYVNPLDVIQTNVLGTSHILEASRELGIEKIIHTSTSETYGTARVTPISEEHPLQGQSPYSASKIGADKIAESYFATYNLPVAILRPFNTYGSRQSARAVIPTIVTQALTKDSIRLGSLDPTRDLTFVADTVRGFLACAESDATIGQTINVGTGKETSIGDLVKLILSLLAMEKPIVADPNRLRPKKSEVMRLICDPTKAKDLMQWEPHVSLVDGLAETIPWIREHLAQYRPETYAI